MCATLSVPRFQGHSSSPHRGRTTKGATMSAHDQATDLHPSPAPAAIPGWVDRSTGPLLIAAGVLALVGNLLHPRYDGQGVDVYPQIADSSSYVAADLLLLAAFLVLTAGLTGLVHRLREAATLARLGYLAVVVGGTIAVAQDGVELFAFRNQAHDFAVTTFGSSDFSGSFWSTNALDGLNGALFATWTVVLLGLAPILISLTLLATRAYPSWLAVLGIVGGALCLGVGVFNLLHEHQGASQTPFLIGSLLVTVWVVAGGVVATRASRSQAAQS